MNRVLLAWVTRVMVVAVAARASCAVRIAKSAAAAVVFAALICGSQPAWAQFVQQGPKLVGSGAAGIAAQGSSLALSSDGNTALVGGPDDNFPNSGIGAAWVFTRSNGAWMQQGHKLVGTGTGATYQGQSVALSNDGNTALIAGPSAWVFTRGNGAWTQQALLSIASAAASVTLSADGNTAVIGTPGDNVSVGAAWVFTRSNGAWTQGQKLAANDEAGQAGFGDSVALSADGNTVIVGGPGDNFATMGAAWVFTRSNGVWTQQGPKLIGNGANLVCGIGIFQGISVALSADGNTAIVGGPKDNSDCSGLFATGAAWVFTRSNGAWTQQGQKLVGDGPGGRSEQGASVALSADGNTALIGGPNTPSGVWVFTRSNGAWTQQGQKLLGTGSIAGSQQGQGSAVALSGDGKTALSGEPGDNDITGATWVFALSLQVNPATNIAASGYQGGPFNPTSFQYQLSATASSLNYTISGIPSWLNANITSGTATTTPTTVTFSLNNVGSLAPGEYTGTIAFTNTDTGNGNTTRTATLTVIGLPTLTATPLSGVAPLAVTFEARIQQGDTNTYTIDFGDGTNSGPLAIRPSGMACVAVGPCNTGVASASHTYSFQGNYTATLHNAVGTNVATVAIAVTHWGGNARSGFARR